MCTYVWRERGGDWWCDETGGSAQHITEPEDGACVLRRNVHAVDEEGAVDGAVDGGAERQQRHSQRRLCAAHEAERDQEATGAELSCHVMKSIHNN